MKIDQIFDSFSNQNVLVVGDMMIDAYISGSVSRISPEAPVPIVHFEDRENRLGGAANVALNLIALGANVFVASVIGEDTSGREMLELFEKDGIHVDTLMSSRTRKTTVKTRILGNKQQLIRVDEEQTNDLSIEEEDEFVSIVEKLLQTQKIDAIIFEDYNKGVLTDTVIRRIISLANQRNIITTVDPKKKNFFSYKNVTLFKPNLKELKEGLNVQFHVKTELDKLEKSIDELHAILGNSISFITLSADGVYIKNDEKSFHFPAHLRHVADVSGAGDTVISVATLCLIAGCSIDLVARISNLAGGLVCEYAGVVPINKEQLREEAKLIIE